jgi:hypothetical protein
MNKSAMPVAVAHRRYVIQLALAMICYGIVLIISLKLIPSVTRGWLQVLVAIAPVVPVIFVLASIVRLLSRIDEMQRRIHLEAMALAAGITALLALTCGFLENAGMPRLSGFWTFASIGVLWAVFAMILQRRYR